MLVGARSEAEVQFALDWVTAAAEAYCEREFAYVQADTVYVNPYYGHLSANGSAAAVSSYGSYAGYGGYTPRVTGPGFVGQCRLPNPPVSNVSQVMGLFGAGGWVELVNYSWAEDGLLWDTTGQTGVDQQSFGPIPSWPNMPRSLQIVYSHGFATPDSGAPGNVPVLPQGLVNAICSAAAYVLVNPANIAADSAGIISNTYHSLVGGNAGPAGAILDEIAFAPYRLVNL